MKKDNIVDIKQNKYDECEKLTLEISVCNYGIPHLSGRNKHFLVEFKKKKIKKLKDILNKLEDENKKKV